MSTSRKVQWEGAPHKRPQKSSGFDFEPSRAYRRFSAKNLVGQTLEVIAHKPYENGNQSVQIPRVPIVGSDEVFFWANGCAPHLNLKEGEHKLKVKDAWLMEHMNGGRKDHGKYPSYAAYYNEEKKAEVQAYHAGGLMGRMMRGGGNPDEVDLCVQFESFTIENSPLYDLKAPEEWYSERFAADLRFRFEAGFYSQAGEAMASFSEKATGDIFGTRYFPVIVFPLETISDYGKQARGVAGYAKASSQPIVTEKHVIFGTRCKPDEVNEVISMTYEAGGVVARAQVWDW